MEASSCAAGSMEALLTDNDLRGGEGRLRCLTSGDVALFTALAPLLLGEDADMEVSALPPMED